MNCPICLESHAQDCSCILDAQNDILKLNEEFGINNKIIEAIDKLIALNYIMLEAATQKHDAKFYSGRLSGINLIKQFMFKVIKAYRLDGL